MECKLQFNYENTKPYSKSKFETLLREKVNYHIHHPFHIAMNSGQCTKKQIQGWVVNRYYYQISILLKIALFYRTWIQ